MGDARSFGDDPHCLHSRACVSIDYDSGQVSVIAAPSCKGSGKDKQCSSALPVGGGHGNDVDIDQGRNDLRGVTRIKTSLNQSNYKLPFGQALPGAISDTTYVHPSGATGAAVRVEGDPYPSIQVFPRHRPGHDVTSWSVQRDSLSVVGASSTWTGSRGSGPVSQRAQAPPNRDRAAIRWLAAGGLFLILGVVFFAYSSVASFSNRPPTELIVLGLKDAGGNSLIFVIPSGFVAAAGLVALKRIRTRWRRIFLIAASLNLLWTLAFLSVGFGTFFMPSAICGLVAAAVLDAL